MFGFIRSIHVLLKQIYCISYFLYRIYMILNYCYNADELLPRICYLTKLRDPSKISIYYILSSEKAYWWWSYFHKSLYICWLYMKKSKWSHNTTKVWSEKLNENFIIVLVTPDEYGMCPTQSIMPPVIGDNGSVSIAENNTLKLDFQHGVPSM